MRSKSSHKIFFRKFITNRNEKKETIINEPFDLDLSILEFSKIVMHEFWYDYVKPWHDVQAKARTITCANQEKGGLGGP